MDSPLSDLICLILLIVCLMANAYFAQIETALTESHRGRLERLAVYGDDYDTPDGTCLRDYIHVMDLAAGHVKALEHIADKTGVYTWNLGSGTGSSVLDVVHAYEKACGKAIPYTIAPRRAGDLPAFWANPEKAARELGWRTERSLDDMMADTWRWQAKNPQGYR